MPEISGYWLIAWIIYSSIVQALPDPDEDSPKWYLFLYQFAHILAMNVSLVKRTFRDLKNGK